MPAGVPEQPASSSQDLAALADDLRRAVAQGAASASGTTISTPGTVARHRGTGTGPRLSRPSGRKVADGGTVPLWLVVAVLVIVVGVVALIGVALV